MKAGDNYKAKRGSMVITLIRSRVIQHPRFDGQTEWLIEKEDESRYWLLETTIESCYVLVPFIVKEWFQALSVEGKTSPTSATVGGALSRANYGVGTVKVIRYRRYSDGKATYDFVDYDGNVL